MNRIGCRCPKDPKCMRPRRLPDFRASAREALLPTPVGVGRFVIRATRERGVGVPSSRSLATASREANSVYDGLTRAHSLYRPPVGLNRHYFPVTSRWRDGQAAL